MQHQLSFYKYQGTGNDFVMIDNRNLEFPNTTELVKKLCDRRFGVGADGLILLENEEGYDFKMVYYNADGNQSTMCGNGGRCLVAFAHFLDIFEENCSFLAIDGKHEAKIKNGIVKLKMIDVEGISTYHGDQILNTGSPHYVKYIDHAADYEVYKNGNEIRNSADFIKEGINVNFVEKISDTEIFVRTYERGVEDETYSCGTGVTACALTMMNLKNISSVSVKTLGGNLKVYAEQNGSSFSNVWLEGPAQKVFEGKFQI